MERGQALGLVVEVSTVLPGDRGERVELPPTVLVPPRPRDVAVHGEGRRGVWRLRAEDQRPVVLGKELRSAGLRQERGFEGWDEPRRGRGALVRERLPREIPEHSPVLVPEPAQAESL